MKTSTILTAALVAAFGLVAYKAFANLPSPAEARISMVLADKKIDAAGIAQTKASWAALSDADKATFNEYVTASDKATTPAEMQAAQDKWAQAFQKYEQAENKNAYVIGMTLFMSYVNKRESLGLPSK